MKTFILSFLLLIFMASMNAQNAVVESSNASTPGVLNVTVTTSTSNGSYAPKNVVAIWIQDSAGKFVKTMMILAASRKADLTNWVTSTPVGNSIDATTGATQSSHGSRTASWNATNASKVLVADGAYTVKIEMTEGNSGSRVGTFTFDKGLNPITLTPANVPSLSNITIKWIPAVTGIEDVKLAKLYTIYPNPTKSSIFVNGLDISQVEILNLEGKSLLKSNLQNVNLSSLTYGTYLAKITTMLGTITKKIIKE